MNVLEYWHSLKHYLAYRLAGTRLCFAGAVRLFQLLRGALVAERGECHRLYIGRQRERLAGAVGVESGHYVAVKTLRGGLQQQRGSGGGHHRIWPGHV